MFKRLWKRFRSKKTDNKGSGLVVVILTLAFVGMLVAMVAYMSLINYRMKYTDRSAKDNFYSAESALDEINAGLQGEMSEVMTNAYSDVMKTAATKSDDERTQEFKTLFKDGMYKKCNPEVGGLTVASGFKNHLLGFLVNTPVVGRNVGGSVLDYGATLSLENENDAVINRYVESENEITLKGIKISYANEQGYVSMIKTDIVITIPEINFAANVTKPDLQMFSLVANEKLEVYDGSDVKVYGNVYGGKEDGIVVTNPNSKITFRYRDSDIQKGSEFYVVANTINVGNRGKVVSDIPTQYEDGSLVPDTILEGTTGRHEVWTNDINLSTADIDLDGKVYVKDDLNLDGADYNGDGSRVKLAGSYIGYGDANDTAAQSSSILINGAKTSIDMSGLKTLILAGHAYVGTLHYDANAKAESSYIENLAAASAEPENYYDYADQTVYYKECPVHGGRYDSTLITCPHEWEEEETVSEKIALDASKVSTTVESGRYGGEFANLFDGDLDSRFERSYFDYGKYNYYTYEVVFDLSEVVEIDKVRFAARVSRNASERQNVALRTVGSSIWGYNGTDWEKLYVITESDCLKYDYVDVPAEIFLSHNNQYSQIKVVSSNAYNRKLSLGEFAVYQNKLAMVKKVCGLTMTLKSEVSREKTISYEQNERDIMLGQSVAMKSDQLIYMVPAECMCYDQEGAGKQVLAKNPLTYEEYLKFTTTYIPEYTADGTEAKDSAGNIIYTNKLKYKVVDLSKISEKLHASLQVKYGASYRPVFRKVSGTVLVYYYLFFDTVSQANKFFTDYYNADPDAIQRYVNSYIKELKLNPSIEGSGTLSLGGNMLTYNSTNQSFEFKKSTYETENADSASYANNQATLKRYRSIFNALDHYLLKDESRLSALQLSRDVFTNLIKVTQDSSTDLTFAAQIPDATKRVYTRTNDAGEVQYKAVAINNDGHDAYKVSADDKTSIIVASGDVIVDKDFSGLIIAGGTITLAGCSNVNYADGNVLSAMMAKNAENGKYFYELFRNGAAYANVTGVAEGTADAAELANRKADSFVIGDLIQYSNWKKE